MVLLTYLNEENIMNDNNEVLKASIEYQAGYEAGLKASQEAQEAPTAEVPEPEITVNDITPRSREILSMYFVGMAEYCVEDCFEDHGFEVDEMKLAYNEINMLSLEQLLAFVPECAEEWDPDNPGFVETMEHAVKCYWADEQNPKTASENGMFGYLIDFEAQME